MIYKTTKNSFYSELDGIRGILCLVILFYHWGLNTIIKKISFEYIDSSDWGIAVDFFFLLSGFVLCNSIRKNSILEFKKFFFKRFLY